MIPKLFCQVCGKQLPDYSDIKFDLHKGEPLFNVYYCCSESCYLILMSAIV